METKEQYEKRTRSGPILLGRRVRVPLSRPVVLEGSTHTEVLTPDDPEGVAIRDLGTPRRSIYRDLGRGAVPNVDGSGRTRRQGAEVQ